VLLPMADLGLTMLQEDGHYPSEPKARRTWLREYGGPVFAREGSIGTQGTSAGESILECKCDHLGI
jgi:hypothetical protein